MLTGRRSQTGEDITLKAGATEYPRKPFDPGVLVVPVSALLSKAARVTAASTEAPSRRV